jgi:hypothetical protein
MNFVERFLKRAEECERLAVETTSPAVRELMLYFGSEWRDLAQEEEERAARAGAPTARKSNYVWWFRGSSKSSDH